MKKLETMEVRKEEEGGRREARKRERKGERNGRSIFPLFMLAVTGPYLCIKGLEGGRTEGRRRRRRRRGGEKGAARKE